jgi:Ferritin-like
MIRIRRAIPAAPPFAEAALSAVEAVADTVSEAEPSPPLRRDQIIREFDDPYLELVRLLRESAQIEHALMVQYLYAAFSVKSQYSGIVGVAFANPNGLLGIAIQEMQHLRYVSDLLSDLGAAPNLTSQDFPYDQDIYPFPLNLERLSRQSLAKYVFTEAPAAAVEPTPGTHDPFLEALFETLGDIRPNHLGSVYGAVITLVRDVQATPPFALPDLSGHITNLEFVKGEGETDHFNFFKSLFLATHSGFGGDTHVWELSPEDPSYPSIAVPTNPSALGGHPGEIADMTLRALARLSNLHYWTILSLIDLSYRYGKSVYMFLAIAHMTGPLLELGRALAAKQMGLPFDPSGLGFSPGIDEAAGVRALILVLEEANTLTGALRDELPIDFSFTTIDDTLAALRTLGDS